MALETWLAILIGTGVGLVLVYAFLLIFSATRTKRQETTTSELDEPLFLLRDGKVVDATPAGSTLIGDALFGDWAHVRDALSPVFSDIPRSPPTTRLRLASDTAPDLHLDLVPERDRLRVGLSGPSPSLSSGLSVLGSATHLARLRRATGLAPYPMWQSAANGEVVWSNERFGKLAALADSAQLFTATQPRTGPVTRERLHIASTHPDLPEWFEVTTIRAGDSWFHYAVDVDAVVEAETAQRNFVQTLAKTFAHLPIGLAIFDRNRQLVLFNPALLDLTQLSVEFLSGRPNLMTFFDQLRENRIMPEPKSYDGWRQQLAELVAAATDDRYSETWSLPNGLTYRIAGRPHPDGAVAFLLEDISSEIALTRRFRAELELCQSVIDTMGEAVAAFNPTGVLTFCNAGYRKLWQSDPDSTFADVTIVDATRLWQQHAQPSDVWSDIRAFVASYGQREGWDNDVRLVDGRRLKLRCDPLPGGATLVRFSEGATGALGPVAETAALAG
ncbi:PAS-domain containing protein [Roseivivax sp. CAU 1753]